jgi:multidrug efflux pump subunit AcrA (membrane-fusion protein)
VKKINKSESQQFRLRIEAELRADAAEAQLTTEIQARQQAERERDIAWGELGFLKNDLSNRDAQLTAAEQALSAERTRKVDLGLRLGQILGREYDGVPLEEIARRFVAAEQARAQAEQERDSGNARFCEKHRGIYKTSGCITCGIISVGQEAKELRDQVEALSKSLEEGRLNPARFTPTEEGKAIGSASHSSSISTLQARERTTPPETKAE